VVLVALVTHQQTTGEAVAAVVAVDQSLVLAALAIRHQPRHLKAIPEALVLQV
jgi:hypothetical protein